MLVRPLAASGSGTAAGPADMTLEGDHEQDGEGEGDDEADGKGEGKDEDGDEEIGMHACFYVAFGVPAMEQYCVLSFAFRGLPVP